MHGNLSEAAGKLPYKNMMVPACQDFSLGFLKACQYRLYSRRKPRDRDLPQNHYTTIKEGESPVHIPTAWRYLDFPDPFLQPIS